jgi:phospholipid-transporting ATPase
MPPPPSRDTVDPADPRRMEQFQKAIRKVRQVQRMRKQRGYAFSQADESQTRVLQAYDTTRERGRYGEMASSRPVRP